MAYVVDTSFLIDVEKGHPGAKRLKAALEDEEALLFIPTVVMAEYLAGSIDALADLAALEAAGEIVDLTREDALAAAGIARDALARGELPGWTDCLIAGVARNRGDVEVLTANPRHFPRARTYPKRR